ncbi:MAG: serine/threonine-protein kinase [Deltaproteobacteria bacterium]|nr:serine/threonine-protein kinase [Deltaproteobacteria bacterium]
MRATAAAQQPERYGRYVLLERIGQGGMAEVFRAVARGTQGFQRILVVKRILPDLSRDPKFVQMFIDEAKICALISHPNVVQVYEFGRLADTHFMTMEYVHGRNLSMVMEKLANDGKLAPPDVICEVTRQACLGLHHAHMMTSAEGKPLEIIHRDVTPANLMLGFNGAVKVLDFGIARAAEELKETRTQAGAVKGKIAYLAPEQIHRKPIDHRIDIYALGVVLHECLTGQRLFKAENPLAAMKAILEMSVPPPSSINAVVPKRVDQIVARAMARDPNVRYANAKAMALDLESALHEMRYFSQRLPNFLKELFKDEVTESKDRILPKELSAISAAMAEPEVKPEPTGAGTGELAAAAANPVMRAWHWLRASTARQAVLAAGVAALLALVVFWPKPKPVVKPSAATAPVVVAPLATPEPEMVRISIDSFPQGAVIADAGGKTIGKTPFTLERTSGKDEMRLTLSLDGFTATTLSVLPDIDKPVFAKLSPVPAAEPSKPAPVKRPAAKPQKRRENLPLDPFAE